MKYLIKEVFSFLYVLLLSIGSITLALTPSIVYQFICVSNDYNFDETIHFTLRVFGFIVWLCAFSYFMNRK